MAQGATLENWARGSEWARDTGVDIARATEGKWRELFATTMPGLADQQLVAALTAPQAAPQLVAAQ